MKKKNTQKIKVLIVDDSFFMRRILRDLIAEDPDIEIVGEANDGVEAIGETIRLMPDVITMDYNMPKMNGLETIEHILKDTDRRPAIIMISATTKEGAEETLASLRAGAVDYIVKPSGELSLDIGKIGDEIISKIKIARHAQVRNFKPLKEYEGKRIEKSANTQKIIAIGASTGGPPVIEDILSGLPGNLDAAVLITQHMPAFFTKTFAERLNKITELEVNEATDGEEIKNGMVYVAPGGFHMLLVETKKDGVMKNFIKLTQDPPVNNFRPSVDVMMQSVASKDCKNKCFGIILTGMGEDGKEGIRAMREAGGRTIAQSPQTTAVPTMPNAIIESRLADDVLAPTEISRRICDLV